MVAAFTGFLAKDNKPFVTEIDAVHHDAILDITKSFPELKGAAQDRARFLSLCDLLEPYILLRNHLAQPVADTTREPNTTRLSYAPPPGLDVTRVLFDGKEATETESGNWEIAPSDKPKFDACGGIPFEQGNAPMPKGCICSPLDYAALGHMTNCPLFVREQRA